MKALVTRGKVIRYTHKWSSFKYRGSWEPGTSKLGFSIDPHNAVGVGKQIPA